MNINDYIPVLQWNQKTMKVEDLYMYIEVPCIFYFKKGYTENKKEDSTKILKSWVEMGATVLHARARRAIIDKIMEDYKKLTNTKTLSFDVDTFTKSWETYICHNRDNSRITVLVTIPKKYYFELSVFSHYMGDQYSKTLYKMCLKYD